MAHDDQARPSQIRAAYWLEAQAPPPLRCPPTPRAATLRAASDLAHVDAHWARLQAATRAGQLGYKAKVATAARASASGRRELRVLLADRADTQELARVQAALRALLPTLRWSLLPD